MLTKHGKACKNQSKKDWEPLFSCLLITIILHTDLCFLCKIQIWSCHNPLSSLSVASEHIMHLYLHLSVHALLLFSLLLEKVLLILWSPAQESPHWRRIILSHQSPLQITAWPSHYILFITDHGCLSSLPDKNFPASLKAFCISITDRR